MKSLKKRLVVIIFIAIIIILGIFLGIYIYNKINDSSKLNLEENQWIDANKHNMIDIAILNNIPIISYDGEGLIYDYLKYVKDETGLEFNIIPYKYGTNVDYQYKMNVVSSLKYGDISIYKDNLVYISIDNHEYIGKEEIKNLKIGVLNSEKEGLVSYFSNSNIEFVGYDDFDKLNAAMKEAKNNLTSGTKPALNGIIILKSMYTKEMIENSYRVAYNFSDLIRYYVINIQDSTGFNSIMKKKYNSWYSKEYKDSYNNNLLSIYYKFKKISDTDSKKLKSKSYNYGFISDGIINSVRKKQLKGFNGILLKEFSDFSGLSLTYTQCNSVNNMIDKFNSGKIDFILNGVNKDRYTVDLYETSGAYVKKNIVVSGLNSDISINDISNLKNQEVLTIKDTNLESYLKDNGIKTKSYNDLKSLVDDYNENNIVILDLENYNYYKTTAFKNSRVSYQFNNTSKYNFMINNSEDNKVFAGLFDFYITYTPIDDIIAMNYNNLAYEDKDLTYIFVIVIIVLLLYIVIDFSYHVKVLLKTMVKRRKIKMTKGDKIKYIDQLTSLKNRNYLNSKIEEWDDSEVYPQSIIIVDLNNISYINDNYGREEGDKVIKEAANILMQYQMENSEIIRTDGNEFLIFLVGYTEKQIVSYLRKLNKELKNLSHGFGAASGYSIITDAIKTFDDAVNEAVLDMKNNKEDIDY